MGNTKAIIVTTLDGSVRVIHKSPNAKVSWAQVRERAEQDPDVSSARLVSITKVPSDRYFRGAWRSTGLTDDIHIDLPAARNIHIDEIRSIRDEKLKSLDIEMLKAIEVGDTVKQAEIVAKKEALRNMPDDPRFESITDPDELKAFMPEILTEDV